MAGEKWESLGLSLSEDDNAYLRAAWLKRQGELPPGTIKLHYYLMELVKADAKNRPTAREIATAKKEAAARKAARKKGSK